MMMLDMVPRLVSKARLRTDGKRGETMLLWPERGLRLNWSAAEILALCTGEHDVRHLVAELSARYPEVTPSRIEEDVTDLLTALVDRGLIEVCSS